MRRFRPRGDTSKSSYTLCRKSGEVQRNPGNPRNPEKLLKISYFNHKNYTSFKSRIFLKNPRKFSKIRGNPEKSGKTREIRWNCGKSREIQRNTGKVMSDLQNPTSFERVRANLGSLGPIKYFWKREKLCPGVPNPIEKIGHYWKIWRRKKVGHRGTRFDPFETLTFLSHIQRIYIRVDEV